MGLGIGGGKIIHDCCNLKKFTKEQLLYLHLSDYYSQRDKPIVSELITEKGIQSVINCNLSHISRILKKNIEEENIYCKLSQIENSNRKQKAFFLSEEGLRIALALKNSNLQLKFESINFTQKEIIEYL